MEGECARLQPGHFDEGLQQEIQLVDLPVHGGQKLRPLFRRQVVAPEDTGKHLDVGDGRLDLVGDVADQALDGLLVPLALALALIHNVEILHQLALHLGGQAVLIGLVALHRPAGHQGVQHLAQVVGKHAHLPPLVPGPQAHHGEDGGAQPQDAPAHRRPGDGLPQQPHQRPKQRRREQEHPRPQDRHAAVFHGLPPVQM